MTTNGAPRAYARVLFDLASTAGAIDEADQGLKAITEVLRSSVDLREALSDASIPSDKKLSIMAELFSGAHSPEAVAVASVVVHREGIAAMNEVHAEFVELCEAERGIVVTEVTTAVPLSDALRKTLIDKLTSLIGKPVSLRESVDESILGGIRINVAGRVLDGTLLSQLDAMRTTLSRAPQGGEE